MNCLSFKKILIFSLIVSFSVALCEAQSFDRPAPPKQQRNVSKKPARQKKGKVIGPKSARKAQNEQAANDRKLKKDYAKFVKENQQRSIEIQTPEVKERMKQNIKNANASYKAKKKNNASRTRNAGKKYR